MLIDKTVMNIYLEHLIYAKYKVPALKNTFSIVQIFDELVTLVAQFYRIIDLSTGDLRWESSRPPMGMVVHSFKEQIFILLAKITITKKYYNIIKYDKFIKMSFLIVYQLMCFTSRVFHHFFCSLFYENFKKINQLMCCDN